MADASSRMRTYSSTSLDESSMPRQQQGSRGAGTGQRRLGLAAYLIALASSALICILAIHGLSQYHPPGTPHDELLVLNPFNPSSGQGVAEPDQENTSSFEAIQGRMTSPASWNSLANALGGFSTSHVHSPQLNVSWLSRPAGFGPRITGPHGLSGILESIDRYAVSPPSEHGEVNDKSKMGCEISLEKRFIELEHLKEMGSAGQQEDAPKIALVQRGECPFIQKLLNAQALNYSAVLVYNDPAHAARPNGPFSGNFGEEDELISMWSPAREARLLSIPASFLSHNTGRTLENLISIAQQHDEVFRVVLEAEEPPHLLLMDVIIMLFFLPTIFTTIVIIISKARMIRHQRLMRAPQAMVDELPTFIWSERLGADIEAWDQAFAEKDAGASAIPSVPAGKATGAEGGRRQIPSRIVGLLNRAINHGRHVVPETPNGNTDEAAARTVSLSPATARTLARKVFSQRECAICLADFVAGETVRLLPCGHIYHVAEIDSWLTGQRRWCPVCRSPIDAADPASDVEANLAGSNVPTGMQGTPNAGGAPPAVAQPIITRDDLEDQAYAPVASSSTANERSPLLPRPS